MGRESIVCDAEEGMRRQWKSRNGKGKGMRKRRKGEWEEQCMSEDDD